LGLPLQRRRPPITVSGTRTEARRRHASRPLNRLGAFPALVVAATFAIIGLDWIGVWIALAIVVPLLLIGLRARAD
jgi:hypothetical protein